MRNHHPLGGREQRAGNPDANGTHHSFGQPSPRQRQHRYDTAPEERYRASFPRRAPYRRRLSADVRRCGWQGGCNRPGSRIGDMTSPFLMRPEILDGNRRRAAVPWARPGWPCPPGASWPIQPHPRLPSGTVSNPSAPMSRMGEPVACSLVQRCRAQGCARWPGHVVLPEVLTGVKAPIVVLLGQRFPMIGAHKVLAAYGCLVPRLVTGRFDPSAIGRSGRPPATTAAAAWRYRAFSAAAAWPCCPRA